MSEEVVDSFASMFDGPPGAKQRASREARKKAEKRTQLTEKQRKRGAVRTDQIGFRCTPAFHQLASGMAKNLKCSIADVMEQALEMLAKAKGYGGAT